MSELSAAKRAEYRVGAVQRQQQAEQRRLRHLARAQEVAGAAASLLRATYHATEVILFGSTAQPARFHERSDVDLIAWGMDERAYVRAVADVNGLDSYMFVDLVRGEEASPCLLAVVAEEGKAL
ncbi:nucleotidyltransferase domain-containing protein [Caldilinea sp.]|uniref:nucleotidyltransferase domain-containing protein n=1 Tax=Caldilinea sp. TaxID=2293560 RepID=UPI002CBFA5FF|nr:nucleotidyltransferase domain-containing protein [Anaerolineales bacterium]HQY95098.1 hypothetical protein [Caldilinea sp.]HRA68285.1 hypothetical protein [Caldilinea sp.]